MYEIPDEPQPCDEAVYVDGAAAHTFVGRRMIATDRKIMAESGRVVVNDIFPSNWRYWWLADNVMSGRWVSPRYHWPVGQGRRRARIWINHGPLSYQGVSSDAQVKVYARTRSAGRLVQIGSYEPGVGVPPFGPFEIRTDPRTWETLQIELLPDPPDSGDMIQGEVHEVDTTTITSTGAEFDGWEPGQYRIGLWQVSDEDSFEDRALSRSDHIAVDVLSPNRVRVNPPFSERCLPVDETTEPDPDKGGSIPTVWRAYPVQYVAIQSIMVIEDDLTSAAEVEGA